MHTRKRSLLRIPLALLILRAIVSMFPNDACPPLATKVLRPCCNLSSHKCSPPSAVSSPPNPPASTNSAADRCCAVIAAEWRKYGLAVERIAQKYRGDHLRIVAPSRAKSQLLVSATTTPSTHRHPEKNALPPLRRQSLRPRRLRHEGRNRPGALRI